MKKIATLLLSLALFTYTSYADDKPIDYEQLPAAAKAFVQAEFPSAAISFVTRDSDLLDTTYDLHFADGLKVEFNSKGEWKEISRKSAPIDDRFVPQKIRENVASRWPDAR
ncbi:MAG: PepSY-like domain-containing protein, partial [Bacteroidales bacterium]|nr:PepSY-like domain-containing protein [Bacteroidales bacterium]